MSFQVVNTQAPNSPSNTCVFSIFEASDSVTNLTVVGDRFGDEVGVEVRIKITRKMQPLIHTYTFNRDKKIKVFVCGDYEFETKSYRLSGASGKLLKWW